MIHNGRMMNICGCCNLGQQGGEKMEGGAATRPGGDQRNKWILEIPFSLGSQSQKRDLHPLALTGRKGQTVLKLPLWLVALFWLFVKCSFLLVHSPLGFQKKGVGLAGLSRPNTRRLTLSPDWLNGELKCCSFIFPFLHKCLLVVK